MKRGSSKPRQLTPEEKQNGARTILIPAKDVQAKMKPMSLAAFTGLIKKAIQPLPPRPKEAK
jgi:hypothetical protein